MKFVIVMLHLEKILNDPLLNFRLILKILLFAFCLKNIPKNENLSFQMYQSADILKRVWVQLDFGSTIEIKVSCLDILADSLSSAVENLPIH